MVRDQEVIGQQQAISTTPTLKVRAQQIHTQNQVVDNRAGNSDGLLKSTSKEIIDAPKWLQPSDG